MRAAPANVRRGGYSVPTCAAFSRGLHNPPHRDQNDVRAPARDATWKGHAALDELEPCEPRGARSRALAHTTIVSIDLARVAVDLGASRPAGCGPEPSAGRGKRSVRRETPYDANFWTWVDAQWRAATAGASRTRWFSDGDPTTWSFVVGGRAFAAPLCGLDGAGVLLRLRAGEVEHSTVLEAPSSRAQMLCGLGLYSTAKTVGPLAQRCRDNQPRHGVRDDRTACAVSSSDDDDDLDFEFGDEITFIPAGAAATATGAAADASDDAAEAASAATAPAPAIDTDRDFALALSMADDGSELEPEAAADDSPAKGKAPAQHPRSTKLLKGEVYTFESGNSGPCAWYRGFYNPQKKIFQQRECGSGWRIHGVEMGGHDLRLDDFHPG